MLLPCRGDTGTSPNAAPWRTAVRTQSIAVSPPPITTTFLPAAFSSPEANRGGRVAEALRGWRR